MAEPTHPGQYLADILPDIPISKSELCRILDMSRTNLYKLLGSKIRISVETSLILGKLLGISPSFFLDMQQVYDLHMARKKLKRRLDAIPKLT